MSNGQTGNIRNTFLLLGIISIVTITLLAGSYGLLVVSETLDDEQTVVTGNFNIDYEDGQSISLDNAIPVTDEEGMKSQSYNFTISNTGDIAANYFIRLEEDPTIDINKKLNASQLKYSIKEEGGSWSKPALLSSVPNLILIQNKSLKSKNYINYSLKIWIDENVGNEGKNKIFKSRIVIEAIQNNLNFSKPIDEPPTITLNGKISENIEQNSSYTDPGVKTVTDDKTAIDVSNIKTTYEYYDGKELSEVSNIDTSKIGVYYINYEVTDNSANKSLTTRTVNIYKKNTQQPTIKLNGESTIHISKDEKYEEQGVIATDESGNNVTDEVVTLGKVDTTKEEPYVLKYIISDDNGNISSVTRTVIVSSTEVVTIKLTKGAYVSEIGSNDTLTCSKNVNDDSCDITLPTIKTENGFVGYWSTSPKAIDGELPGATVSVSEDITYYALASKKVKITYETGNDIDKIGKESDSCIIQHDQNSCSIILPQIDSKIGYDVKFWSTSEESTQGISPRRTVKVSEDTTFYSKALDVDSPICKLEKTSDRKINTNDAVVVTINCYDKSETISQDLTSDNITVLVDKTEVIPKEKEIIKTNYIEKGKQYILTLQGFPVSGNLTLIIKKSAIKDKSENSNPLTTITTGIKIK